MAKQFSIGAPSITGIDANKQVEELFSDAKFPLKIRLTNHLPRNLSLPEVGVFLKPLDGKEEAVVKDLDGLHRLASSIEQISELNSHPLALTIEDLTPPAKTEAPVKPAAKPAATETKPAGA